MEPDIPEEIAERMSKDVYDTSKFNKRPGNRGTCCWQGGLTLAVMIGSYGAWQM